MREPTFLILTAPAAEPAHGYGALDRLTEQGLVEVEREEAVDGRLRRYDRLTDSDAAADDPSGGWRPRWPRAASRPWGCP